MLNVGWGEMGLLLLVALIVFGPNRLPEMARSMGKFIRQFQRETSRAMSDLKEGLEPIKTGIFDEPDDVTAPDPVGAGAVEPVADVPPTRPLATTRRKTSTPPQRRAAAARTRKTAAARKPATKKATAKRPAAERPLRRTAAARKPRRRA